ncbi:MAG: PQQ-binding-like beta-propeller repeat protein [Bacteroidota bacterium]
MKHTYSGIKKTISVLICLGFVFCSKSGDSGNEAGSSTDVDSEEVTNNPPSAVSIETDILGNNVGITWEMATDDDGDRISYALIIGNETIIENLTTTFYALENLEYDTVYSGKLIISDGKEEIAVSLTFKTDIKLTYFAYSENSVYALNGYTGEEIWTNTAVGDTYESAPFYFSGKLFIGGDRKIYCLDAEEGNQIWEYDNPTNEYTSGEMFFRQTPIVDSDNNIIHVSAAGRPLSYGLDLDTGQELCKFFEEDSYYGVIGSVPISTHYNNSVISSTPINERPYGRIVQLNKLTGEKEWEYIGEHEFSYAPIIMDNECFILSNGGLYCIDLRTKERKWLLYNEQAHANLVVNEEELLYFVSGTQNGSSNLRSIRPDGSLIWERNLGVRAYHISYRDGKLLLNTSQGFQNDKIIVIDGTDGTEITTI